MLGRKKLDLEKMTYKEMEDLERRLWQRFFLLNGLWCLFVVIMLFLLPVLGVILLIVTAIKYFYDYHDVESQAHHGAFLDRMGKKRNEESD